MAFKVEDKPWSSENQRKRKNRAANIVREKIPSNEYQVNRSGKLACMVCPKWPVFDTYPMLANHRDSVRHQENKKTWDDLVIDKEFAEQKKKQKTHIKQQLSDNTDRGAPLITRTKDVVTQILDGNFYNNEVPKESNLIHEVIGDRQVASAKDTLKNNISTEAGDRRHLPSHFPVQECSSSSSQKDKTEIPKGKQGLPNAGVCSTMTKEQCKSIDQRKHELKLLQAGWIKDASGNWVKDENCEFDSDEETPG